MSFCTPPAPPGWAGKSICIEMQIDRAFARIAEGLVHYRHAGAGERPPLVMLHASPASSHSLAALGSRLAVHGPVIMPDTPGNGLSCPPVVAAPSLATYADMLDRACTTAGLEAVDLYGTHTGAHIAIEWALAHPRRIRRLVLDGVAILSPEQRAEFLQHYAPPRAPDAAGTQFPWAFNLIRDQMIFWPHYAQDAAHMRSGGRFDPRLLHDLTMDLLGALDSYHHAYHAVFRHEPLARLALLGQTTLWLKTADAPLDGDNAAAIAAIADVAVADVNDDATRAAAISAFLQRDQ
jgi:pimeloyl-ACP methyl ester carboxylesterase